MKQARYVLEATWSGYTSAQRKVCHREVITTTQPHLYQELSYVPFSDGTGMSITWRKCAPREKVQQLKAYSSMIRDHLYKTDPWVKLTEKRKAKVKKAA